MQAYEQLKQLVAEAEEDIRKAEGGNKAAGTRARKQMQEIKAAAQAVRPGRPAAWPDRPAPARRGADHRRPAVIALRDRLEHSRIRRRFASRSATFLIPRPTAPYGNAIRYGQRPPV